MVIIQICQRCGNRLQPYRGKINGMHSVPSVGVCDICHCTTRLYDPDRFGLPIMDLSPVAGTGSSVERFHESVR